MTPVKPPLRFYGQKERLMKFENILHQINKDKHKVDVIVFQELIPQEYFDIMKNIMEKNGYTFHTPLFYKSPLSVSNGVTVFSKHIIVNYDFIPFEISKGIDSWSSKGVIYAKIRMRDKDNIHIFATHLQSNEKHTNARNVQVDTFKDFIQKQKVPKSECVFIVGDLNMDQPSIEFSQLKKLLKMQMPQIHKKSHQYTFDPLINNWVGIDQWPVDPNITKSYPNGCFQQYHNDNECPCCKQQWLDYILSSTQHRKPNKSFISSLPIQVEEYETKKSLMKTFSTKFISDHFPIIAHFQFEQK